MADNDATNAQTRAAPGAAGPPASPAAASARPEFLALRSGLAIRQYVIDETIGAGGFGITYRARHARLTSKVFALKEYFPREFAGRDGTRVVSTPEGDGTFRWGLDRFLKEAEALARCEHPGIVDVVDYFEENGTAYAVLGYVDGQQMGQWLAGLGQRPTQAELDRVLMPLLDALEVVHAAGLLHLDIAPDNILIRRDGQPCLIDFGACREDIRGRSAKVSAIVKHGYSPPEQYHGAAELQGPWTDIYAVGATLYRAISGAPPVDSSRRGALGDTLKPTAEVAQADYRPGFLAAIDQSLRLKPEERPRSIAEWRAQLTAASDPAAEAARAEPGAPELQAGLREAAADAQPAPQPSRAWRRSRPLLIGGMATALLGTLAAVALLRAPVPMRPEPPIRTEAPKPPTSDPPLTTGKEARIETPPADPEQVAATAWAPIATTGSMAEIEGFLARHGGTRVAEQARARLAVLGLEAGRQRELEAAFKACSEAPEAQVVAACTRVADSDDTAARRATALHRRGVAERKAGHLDRAIADLGQSLALRPDQPDVLNDRGIAHFLKGDGVQAIRDYGEAVRLDPRHAEALNNRAWALFRAGRAAEALPDADRAAALAPATAYVLDTRGHILEALGRRDDAIRDYERALALDGTQEASRSGLARLRPQR